MRSAKSVPMYETVGQLRQKRSEAVSNLADRFSLNLFPLALYFAVALIC
jgi:hypothetical protein